MSNSANANPLRIVSADFDPYSYAVGNGGAGAMYEIVQELAHRVGQSKKIEFMPWARAQAEVQANPDMGILPLARVPERETLYTWLVPVLDDPYVFFAKKNSKVNISTIAAAKHLRIGTFAGSLAEVLLRKLGFDNFQSVTTDVQNVQMLKLDRIDVWVAPLSFKNRYKLKGGLGGDELRVGATIVVLHEYFAASKSLGLKATTKWREAFESMKKDGSYQAIMKKYDLLPLK